MLIVPKIFVVYHKPYTVFKNDVFEPIQTGTAFSNLDLGFLKDTGGDDIGTKNARYGELTAWYWILKNYLPAHPEVTHVGFCHYRRFLDFSGNPPSRPPFSPIATTDFVKRFSSDAYAPKTIAQTIAEADILLPVAEKLFSWRLRFIGTVKKHFIYNHPQADLELMRRAYLEVHPEAEKTIARFLSGSKIHTCLHFVMKRELFVEMATDFFKVLSTAESIGKWNSQTDYMSIRAPAFLVERFLNVWCLEQQRVNGVHIKYTDSFQLFDDIPKRIPISSWANAALNRLAFTIGIKR